MKKITTSPISPQTLIVIPIILAIIGFQIGKNYVTQYYDGAFAEWIPLGQPPASVNQIWSPEFYEPAITVQTVDGKLYKAEPQTCQAASINCWVEQPAMEQNAESQAYISSQCQSDYERIQILPAHTKQCASLEIFGADIIGEVHFALLEDNSLWFWEFHSGGLSPFFLNFGFLLVCVTTGLGLLLGLIIAHFLRRRIGSRMMS